MFTILGADGKEYGPVTADKIREWIRLGRANVHTSIRRVGDPGWTTIAALVEFNPAAAAPAVPVTPPAPPLLPPGIPPGPEAASAAPAPGGAAPAVPPAGLPGDARTIAAALIARAAPLDVFGCLARSFALWQANFLPLVGVTLLVMFLQAVAGVVPGSAFFLNGVFTGGLFYYYLGTARGEPREVGDAFAGFSKAFVPLMLATLLRTAIVFALMLPLIIPWFLFIYQAVHHGLPPAFTPGLLLWFLLGFLVMLYLSVSWCFTFILVIDRGLGPWTAMEVSRRVVTSQWFRVFFVLLLGGILTLLGLFGLIIGIFFTLPLVFGTMIYAYEDLCHPPEAAGPG
jgi:hypothetical protein